MNMPEFKIRRIQNKMYRFCQMTESVALPPRPPSLGNGYYSPPQTFLEGTFSNRFFYINTNNNI